MDNGVEPTSLLTVGQHVKVMVTAVERDRQRRRQRLSARRAEAT